MGLRGSGFGLQYDFGCRVEGCGAQRFKVVGFAHAGLFQGLALNPEGLGSQLHTKH